MGVLGLNQSFLVVDLLLCVLRISVDLLANFHTYRRVVIVLLDDTLNAVQALLEDFHTWAVGQSHIIYKMVSNVLRQARENKTHGGMDYRTSLFAC
jgi:hypothetical protein